MVNSICDVLISGSYRRFSGFFRFKTLAQAPKHFVSLVVEQTSLLTVQPLLLLGWIVVRWCCCREVLANMVKIQQVRTLSFKVVFDLFQYPRGAISDCVNPRFGFKSTSLCDLPPDPSGSFSAAQSRRIIRLRSTLGASAAEFNFPPEQDLAFAPIPATSRLHDWYHAPVHLRYELGSSFGILSLWNRNNPTAMGQSLLAYTACRHADSVMLLEACDTFLKGIFCPEVHQHTLQAPGVAVCFNPGLFTERSQRFASPR